LSDQKSDDAPLRGDYVQVTGNSEIIGLLPVCRQSVPNQASIRMLNAGRHIATNSLLRVAISRCYAACRTSTCDASLQVLSESYPLRGVSDHGGDLFEAVS